MNREEVILEIRSFITSQLRKEHDFRVSYLASEHESLRANPRAKYYQLKRSALWMAAYSHINWIAHFKFLKTEKVDADIPGWLSQMFDWPEEVAIAFWFCGRNPIAHTGTHNVPYAKNINGVKHHILLNFDDPEDWYVTGAYNALPITQTKRGKGELPSQQTIFFYQPTEELLVKLVDDVALQIQGFNHADILKLQKVIKSFSFFTDDGSLARLHNYLEVYIHLKH